MDSLTAIASAAGSRAKRVAADQHSGDRERGWKPGEAGRLRRVAPMDATDVFARRATLSRSLRLLSEFRYEQSDPARFYSALAADTATMVTDLWRGLYGESPVGRSVLDVGGGPGYFATAFADVGIRYIGVEPDPREMHSSAHDVAATAGRFVRASGAALPFADDSVDICLSSNVAEHVPRPWQLGTEMLRVTRPVGLTVLCYTVWLGPFGGHELGCAHYLGGARAAARYARKYGHPAKNDYGSSLFAVSAAAGLTWAASTGAMIAAFPRYHPRWAWWMTSVPLLREFLVSNLVLVLRPARTGDTT